MSAKDAKIADCSFLQFVYPFTFEAAESGKRTAALDGQKDVWLPKEFLAGETLSHVADYLRPREGHPREARLWKLSEQNHMPLRLTRDLDCRLKADKREILLTFSGVQRNSPALEAVLTTPGGTPEEESTGIITRWDVLHSAAGQAVRQHSEVAEGHKGQAI